MSPIKPRKIPLFGLASGRTQVDDRLGVSFQQLAQRVPFRYTPHRHDFYHVVWIDSGTGTFIRDGQNHPVESGTLVFVPPGQVHTWKWKDTLAGYLLSFEPALLFSREERPDRLLHELTQWSNGVKNQARLTGAVRDLLQAAFEDLAQEFGSNDEFRDDMLRAQITALLIRLHRLLVGGAPLEAQEHFA